MDISKSIYYRGLNINNVVLETGRVLRGVSVESVDYSVIDVVGYTEKRAAADGIHASDVYLGARIVDMSGFIYAANLAEMFDYLHTMRAVFSPTSAYQESPGDRGFLPLQYQQQTEDIISFPEITGPVPYPAGTIPLYMNVRPQRALNFRINRDRQSPKAVPGKERPTATAWSVVLIAKDPRVYIDPPKIDAFSGSFGPTAGTAVNRGDYETPVNLQLIIGAAPGAVKTFRLTGLNNVDMSIKIENVANIIYRWMGDDRVLMTQDVTGGITTRPLVLRQDLVTFATKQRRPMVPAAINPPTKPFSTGYSRTCDAALAVGSRMFWSEAFA